MYIDKDHILAATRGGLDIILYYYPQAEKTLHSCVKEFAIRDERTPSARLKELQDGNWVITDFGSDQIPRNGIQVCMHEENLNWKETLLVLAQRYSIEGLKLASCKPQYSQRPATASEAEGSYHWTLNETIAPHELEMLGPMVTPEVCKTFGVHSIQSYTFTKNRITHQKTATPLYPLFLIDQGAWQKIYEPQAHEKQYRFKYVGNKEKDVINGIHQVRAAWRKHDLDQQEALESGKIKRKTKLPAIIICSGETDSYNVYGMGYPVVWLNSETTPLTPKQHKELLQYTEQIYCLFDIDPTGIKAAIQMGMQWIDIKIIWLHQSLSAYKDKRGHPRKDIKDYLELYSKQQFAQLFNVAMPMRFWDSWIQDNGQLKYEFNPEQAFHFLQHNGFVKLQDKNSKEGVQLVHINKNIVRKILIKDISHYMDTFIRTRHLPIPLRNMMHRTKQLSEAQLLSKLPEIKIDFTSYTRTSQFLFFQNKAWEVSSTQIIEHALERSKIFVWEENIIPCKVEKLPAPFTITHTPRGIDIEIHNLQSCYFRVLINTSRMHWKQETKGLSIPSAKEYYAAHLFEINSEHLSEDERYEQRLHLINKIYSIGYLLHRYKDPAKPWAVFAMDNKDAAVGESNGGSGKSVVYKAIRHFMKSVTLPGRNPKLTENPHIYDRVTEHTDYILVDDADQYINFGFFYDALTGELIVNPKNNQSYEIPYAQVPKYCFTSNFAMQTDDSAERRLLYTVFSDWYHKQSVDGEYHETRTLFDDFKKNIMMDDYEPQEWNADFNFFAHALSFYLGCSQKIDPPMDKVYLRKQRSIMTEVFFNWASAYFSPESNNLNMLIARKIVFDTFVEETKMRSWTMNKFTKALPAFCKYMNYTLNPSELCNAAGRISRKDAFGRTADFIYIKTP